MNTDSNTIDPSLATKKLLVVVGGTRPWFQSLQKAVRELRPHWSLNHSTDNASALNRLASCFHDAIVTHDRLPGAAELSAVLAKRFPFTPVIALGEHTSQKGTGQVADSSGDENEASKTAENVVRSVTVQDWMAQPSVKNLLARIKTLPILPKLHIQVTEELQSPNGSLEVVSQYIRSDPVMAAKFLQVVNSASFGLTYAMEDPAEAVMFLGVVRTRALVLAAGLFSQFDEMRCSGFSPQQIWNHSLQVASLAQGVTLLQTEDPKLAETAFTAGLLHDIGKLVMAGNIPEMYATAHRLQQTKRIEEVEAEQAILNASHADLGACLLGNWCLPLRIVEAVAWHHKPSLSSDRTFSVLTAVHAGNVLAHETPEADKDIAHPSRFDVFYLAKLGLASQRNAWREGCGLPVKDEQDTYEDQLRRQIENASKQEANERNFQSTGHS